jgi:hypothetical protein
MIRVLRDVLVVLVVAAILIAIAGAVGQHLGNWTDKMPAYVAMLVWIGWEAILLLIGVFAIWFWRHHRPNS